MRGVLNVIWILSSLACGTVLSTLLFSSIDIRRSFHRFNFISSAILWLLVLPLILRAGGYGEGGMFLLALAGLLFSLTLAVLWEFFDDRIRSTTFIVPLWTLQAILAAWWAWLWWGALVVRYYLRPPLPNEPPDLNQLPHYYFENFLTAAVLLGITHVSMILGHWYLIMRNLSFEHLIKASKLFLWAVIIRTVWTAVEIAVVSAPIRDRWLGEDAMFVMMRVVWGLAMPLVLAFFTLRLAKTQNNQAATGMLYVCEFCVLGGEAMAAYLRM